MRTAVSLGAMVAVLAAAAPAIAQVSAPADAAASGSQSPAEEDQASSATRAKVIAGLPDGDDTGPEVVVTGTRIQRPNVASAAPITSVTSQNIRAQAPVNVEEVLNRLPQIAPDNQQTYQDSDGRQRIKLRSLGFERTLTLIDGKRIGTQNGADTGIIPVSLLERVDILTGGASSVYGSDAVAGVVNFILKPDFKGVRFDGNYNFYQHGGGDTIVGQTARASGFPSTRSGTAGGGRADVTLTAGTGLFDDKLLVSGFVNYRQADEILNSARSNSSCFLQQTTKDGPLSCLTSTYSQSGYIAPQGGPNSGTAYVNNPDGTRTFVPYGTGAGKASNPYDDTYAQRPFTRWNAGGFVTLKLAPEAEIYANGIWFRDKSSNSYPARLYASANYPDTQFLVNCNNPFLSASQASTICGTAAGSSTQVPVDVRYRFTGVDPASDRYLNKGLRLTGGVRGKFGGAWTYDVGGVYARNQQNYMPGPLQDPVRVNRALNVVNVNGVPTCVSKVDGTDPNCVPFDAFKAGSSDRAALDYINAGRFSKSKTVTKLYDGLINVTGDLGHYGITSPFANDGVAIAVGGEYREDQLVSTANEVYRADNGGDDISLKQHVWEANAELQVPLIQDKRFIHLLQGNGGVRASKYNTNSGTFITWKGEGLYAPIPDIVLRASFNKAQRAPTVIEIRQATSVSYGTQGGSQGDFCAPQQIADPNNPGRTILAAPLASREVCRATGLSDALYGSPTLICPDNQCTVKSGGFTADPETAYTQTYGVVLKPRFIKGLVLSIDRYRIKINNSLGYNDYSYFQDGCQRSNGDPFFCSAIVRNPTTGTLSSPAGSNPETGYIRQGTTNYYFSIARGWDFQGQYSVGLSRFGRMDVDFNGSLTTFAGGQDSPIQPLRNCTGYYGNGCGQLLPRWGHTLRTTYTTNNNLFSASLAWRYVGSLTSANNSGDEAIGGTPDRAQTTFYHIAPQSYFDLAFTYQVAKSLSLRLIANNLLDRNVPILSNSYDISLSRANTIPQRYDSLGRNIAIGATVNF